MTSEINPKAFISYSWSSPRHEEWVIRLATELRGSGVDVILDKWDLKEGHDAIAFMETMVNDETVRKVILILDKKYVEKTEKRTGGVGTEAQIISPQIYAKNRQDKFVALVTELDQDGIPYVPTYYRSRIFIDMSDEATYSEKFEQLIRWIFDKPLIQKPALGKTPAFLERGGPDVGSASLEQRRAMHAIREGSNSTGPLMDEYFERLREIILGMRIDPKSDPFDQAVVDSISQFSPQKAEFVDLVDVASRYLSGSKLVDPLRRGLERLLPLMFRPNGVTQYFQHEWDNWKFIVNELFLYVIASLEVNERFDELADLLSREFYMENGRDLGEAKMMPFTSFRQYLTSLEQRSRRLATPQGRRTSIHADLLKDRSQGSRIGLAQIMQGEFSLYLRGELVGPDRWWPQSLLYADNRGAFEIFARAKSHRYFERIKAIFGVSSGEEFREKIRALVAREKVPQYGWHSLEVWELSGAKEIDSSP